MLSIGRGLQSRIIIFFVALMLLVQLGAFLLIDSVGERNARATVREELVLGNRVFAHLLDENSKQLAQGARILAADYAFREALASHDQETIVSALDNQGARIQARVMMLVGLDRVVIADTVQSNHVGQVFPVPGLIDIAKTSGIASSIVSFDDKLYQVVVVPVAAPLALGWVAMGFAIDDAAAANFSRLTGLQVSFANRRATGRWTLQATTLDDGQKPRLDAMLNHPTFVPSGERVVQASGDEWETLISTPSTVADQTIVVVLQDSLDRALADFDRLRARLIGVSLIGILISIVGSVVIARGISHPVRELAAFARRIGSGSYSDPPMIARDDEIGDLASAFDHMRTSIASRESRITDLAYRDTLTGLPNRALFTDRLNQALANGRRRSSPLSLLIMDLDHFKLVNDTLGHPVGDRLLVEVAKRIEGALLRETDTVARLGGDEFAILLPNDDMAGAQLVAMRVIKALDAPIEIDGQVVDTRGSIGIATCPEHGTELETLVRRADVAMYLAKGKKSGFAVYAVEHDQHTADRLSLMSELRKAVEKDELVLFYQPKISLTDPRLHFVEALVRWRHPVRGFVPPLDFIPFAEQTGYIRMITLWVLEQATAQHARWQREGLMVNVSINLSARDLMNSELPQLFAAMLERHGCDAQSFCLEITESAIFEDAVRAIENLERLDALGCKLSIDDYGTGYSSLSYLKKLPVHELKIDKSFIIGMGTEEDDVVIVRSTIDLAHNMGLTVTAEGVEDQATLDRLTEIGCDMAQGYLMSKPLSSSEAGEWMRHSPWASDVRRATALRLVG